MGFADDPLELTPNQFEAAVKRLFERDSIVLESYNSRLREKIDDDPEQYEIDIAIRFASKSPCLVFVECKNHKSKIKRQQVEALRDTVESTGAQKGIMVSAALILYGSPFSRAF